MPKTVPDSTAKELASSTSRMALATGPRAFFPIGAQQKASRYSWLQKTLPRRGRDRRPRRRRRKARESPAQRPPGRFFVLYNKGALYEAHLCVYLINDIISLLNRFDSDSWHVVESDFSILHCHSIEAVVSDEQVSIEIGEINNW